MYSPYCKNLLKTFVFITPSPLCFLSFPDADCIEQKRLRQKYWSKARESIARRTRIHINSQKKIYARPDVEKEDKPALRGCRRPAVAARLRLEPLLFASALHVVYYIKMQDFLTYAKSRGIYIGEKELEQFQKYLNLLLEWNEKMNLTAIVEPEDIWIKHFLDSLTVLEAMPKDAKKIIDIGSGAGFPGLPLAIVRPDLDITLLEATGKKVKFLEAVIEELNLKNVRAIHGRADEAGGAIFERLVEGVGEAKQPDPRTEKIAPPAQYDIVLARAVALLPRLWEYAWPLLVPGGILIAQKKSGIDEVDNGIEAITKRGGKIEKIVPISLSPKLADRQLVVIERH